MKPDDFIEVYKTRLLIKSYKQRGSHDYFDSILSWQK